MVSPSVHLGKLGSHIAQHVPAHPAPTPFRNHLYYQAANTERVKLGISMQFLTHVSA